ncbi:unnamed protein product, partial [Amoebophrya sp. A120]
VGRWGRQRGPPPARGEEHQRESVRAPGRTSLASVSVHNSLSWCKVPGLGPQFS